MTKIQLQKFISYLDREGYSVIGPVKIDKRILIRQIDQPKELDLSNQLPLYSFKKYFIPPCETLFKYDKGRFKSDFVLKKQALFNVSIFDLKSILLYNYVFEKDPYYQARLASTLIIGQDRMPSPDMRTFQVWQKKYEEEVLEHLQFDIFLDRQKKKNKNIEFKILTGSHKGQRILKKFGYKSYEHIQFAGPVKKPYMTESLLEVKDKMSRFLKSRIWEKLGQKCIECGKCSIVCPTCFCFDMADCPNLKDKQGARDRYWACCFYDEFSEITGGEKFLNTTAERIYYWYYHKFVRIPDEYSFPGCVGCGRCTMACPAGIDICQVLSDIKGKK